jgi:HEAT repeat protein
MGKRAIPALMEALSSEDQDVQGLAAFSLSRMGSPRAKEALDARAALPKIAQLATDREKKPSLRRAAAEALGWFSVREGEAIRALNEALHDPDEGVRSEAAKALGRINR